jgi:CDP-glucose 4,6-dehydratase
LETVVVDRQFWRGRSVFMTGHTGFKGSWLTAWLTDMGANVTGYSLPAPTSPSLYDLAGIRGRLTDETLADIRDTAQLNQAMQKAQPEVVIHMAAQPIVLRSYDDPVDTFSTNVVGTAAVLDAVRRIDSPRVVINVTSDKCYENREWAWGYRETDPMGGYDPYSASKGCAELVASAMRSSFFNPKQQPGQHPAALASVRAGNVIGGGDWAEFRLIPDMMNALASGKPCIIRNPHSIRPWQHVLEPLSGYLLLAEKMWSEGHALADGWNFGPPEGNAQPVGWIADRLVSLWGQGAQWQLEGKPGLHENVYLKLDISKARARLGWAPRWTLAVTLEKIVDWYRDYQASMPIGDVVTRQIHEYEASGAVTQQSRPAATE